MMENEYKYELIDFGQDPTMPIPKGLDIFYRCTLCGAIVPSVPEEETAKCECKYFNIDISIPDFKMTIVDYSKLEVLRRVIKK